jgi:hypothetical protein
LSLRSILLEEIEAASIRREHHWKKWKRQALEENIMAVENLRQQECVKLI